jgi:hypothetical protein
MADCVEKVEKSNDIEISRKLIFSRRSIQSPRGSLNKACREDLAVVADSIL